MVITTDSIQTTLLLHLQGSVSVDVLVCSVRSRRVGDTSVGIGRPLPPLAHVLSISPFFMATANKAPVAPATNKPVQAFRMRGISVAIFANLVARKNGNGKYPVHNISLQRTYRDGDDYKTTSVFRRDDLPILQRLLQQAWDYIVDVESDQAPEEEPE